MANPWDYLGFLEILLDPAGLVRDYLGSLVVFLSHLVQFSIIASAVLGLKDFKRDW